jgi:hypothetical protein
MNGTSIDWNWSEKWLLALSNVGWCDVAKMLPLKVGELVRRRRAAILTLRSAAVPATAARVI